MISLEESCFDIFKERVPLHAEMDDQLIHEFVRDELALLETVGGDVLGSCWVHGHQHFRGHFLIELFFC